AIGAMMLLRCLHPPGGACALLAATATPAIHQQGALFVLSPVAINVVALLVIAYLVHNLTGHHYPHRPAKPQPVGPAQAALGITTPDVEEAMKRLADRLDVLPADVVAIVQDAENHALDRRLGSIPVARIMNTDPAVVHPFESIYRARLLFTQRGVKTLPVIDNERHVVGVISIIDVFTRELV
ncbi:MAG TPA: HPP family protein, partial [Ilumatobacteraceae bacterium]|nr:HPP family protein [Ilumatobacteraceae bacterium]